MAFSERPSVFVVRQEPEMAFDPAGPLATRVASPLPVTGGPPLVLLMSLKEKVRILPSGETVVVEVETTLPSFLSVSWMEWSLRTLIATVL